MVSQQVVPIEAGSADGWLLVEAGVWSVPVVVVEPVGEPVVSLLGVLVGTSISPFSECGLDEAFCFSVGARGVGFGATVFDSRSAAGLSELSGTVAGAVIGEHGFEADAELCIPGERGVKSGDGRVCLLVGVDGGKGDAAVVVDGDMDILVAASAHPVALVAGGVEGPAGEAAELLDIEMKHVSRGFVLIARIHRQRFQVTDAVELETAQDAADRGPAHAGMTGDPATGPALPPQARHGIDLQLRSRAAQPMRTRAALPKTVRPILLKTPDPLGRRLRRDAEAGRGQLQRHTLFHHAPGKTLSTPSRQSGILMTVHSILSG